MSLARKNSILSKTINVDHSANGDTLFIPNSGIVNISGILTATSGNFSSQTGNTIAGFDGSKNIVSLPTSTYPSFTELSYVKGVTSSIQTQIDTKAATSTTITAGSGLAGGGSLAANRTIDIGQGDGITVSADSIAVDSTVIRTTGTQTITGNKTISVSTGVGLTLTNTGTGYSFVVNDESGDSTPFTVDSSGNVGIKSTSLASSLNVVGNSAFYQSANGTPTLGSKNFYCATFENFSAGYGLAIGGVNTSTGSTFIQGQSFVSSVAYDLLLQPLGGNVGIGTSSPSFKLDVSGAGRIGNGVSQGGPSSTDIKATAHTLLSGTGGNYLAFGQYGSGGSNYAQWIQSSFDNPSTATYNLVLQPLGGNVGIGTSPSVRLHISRDSADLFRLQNTAANGGTWDFKVGGGGFQNKNLVITRRTDGADSADLIINNTGNVGIAAEPVADYKLFVNGALRSDSATTYPSIIGIKSLTNTSTGTNLESATYGYTTTNGSYSLQGLVTNIFHKIDSGRTNSASAIAFVNNNLRNYALTNDAGTISALYGIYNQFGHYNTSAVSPTTTDAIGFNSLFWRATGTITNAYDIYCQDVSSGAAVPNRWGIYITHTGKNYFAGNVGIGAASTSVPEVLSVMQDNNGGRTSILIDNLDQRLKMSCYYQAGVGQYAEIQSLSNSEATAYTLILQRQGGGVLIGTATSNGNYLLQVNSQIYATNATIATSDSRFKTNVTPINNATSIIQSLRPVSFDFIPQTDRNFSSDRQIGLIAQEVQEVLSNIDYKDSIVAQCGDHFGLAYEKLVPILIKALQETNQELQNIKNRLSALEGE